MKQNLLHLKRIKEMSQVPIYLKILCTIHNDGNLVKDLDTQTKTHIASCLIFLREHMLKDNTPLIDMCHNEQVLHTITELSKLAYHSLLEETIAFNAEQANASRITKSGIVEIVEGDDCGNVFHFQHLVFQEYFSAIYIANNSHLVDIESIIKNSRFTNSVIILFGLLGIYQQTSIQPNYVAAFCNSVLGSKSQTFFQDLIKSILMRMNGKIVIDIYIVIDCYRYIYL